MKTKRSKNKRDDWLLLLAKKVIEDSKRIRSKGFFFSAESKDIKRGMRKKM